MQDIYVDQLVKAEETPGQHTGKKLWLVLTMLLAAVTLLIDMRAGLLLIPCLIWRLLMNRGVRDYYYQYINGELSVEAVQGSRKTNLGTWQTDQLQGLEMAEYGQEGDRLQAERVIRAVWGTSGNPICILTFRTDDGEEQVVLEPKKELLEILKNQREIH